MDDESVWNVWMRTCRVSFDGGWDFNEGWGDYYPPWWPTAVGLAAWMEWAA